jgi:phosphoglycolate phosphatase
MTPLHGTTIVFDLDGTLVDTAPDLIGATDHVLASIGLGPANALRQRDKISFGARRMIIDALSEAGRVLSDDEVDALHSLFIAHYEDNIARTSRPYRFALETLRSLKSSGARLAVCTNKKESLARALLVALSMDHHFDAIAGFETFPVSKPHPEHILGTIRLAGGDRDRAIMVGDSENDVKAARAAGVPVIGCLFGYTDIPMSQLGPDAVIGDYFELHSVINSLVAGRAT